MYIRCHMFSCITEDLLENKSILADRGISSLKFNNTLQYVHPGEEWVCMYRQPGKSGCACTYILWRSGYVCAYVHTFWGGVGVYVHMYILGRSGCVCMYTLGRSGCVCTHMHSGEKRVCASYAWRSTQLHSRRNGLRNDTTFIAPDLCSLSLPTHQLCRYA